MTLRTSQSDMDESAAFETVDQLTRTADEIQHPIMTDYSSLDSNFKAASAEATSPFRFLDLPAEIRNQILRLVMYRDHPLRLRCFKPPAITRVSRQLRLEALPVFFDITVFIAEVKTTYTQRGYAFFSQGDIRYNQAGTLNLRLDTISLLKTAGDIVVRIKNLDLVPLDYYWTQGKSAYMYSRATVSLRASEASQLPMVTRHPVTHIYNNREFEEDLKHISEQAKIFLETQAARPGFNGLTFSELKDLAHTLKVVPRDVGRQAPLYKRRLPRAYRRF